MWIIMQDPGNPGENEESVAAAEAAAQGTGDIVSDDEPSLEARAMDAFDEGASEAEDAPAPKPKEDDDDGEGEGDDDSGAPAGDGGEETDEQRAEREKSEREAAAKAEDDKAVSELNLRGKAEQRFRDLSGQVRDLSEKLEAVGGEDVLKTINEIGGKDGLERVVRDAGFQREWDQKLDAIGCSPEQFGNAIGAIAAFNSNDPKALEQAREYLLRSVGEIDEKLGRKSEHFNPLDAHADLKAKVQKGDMDEEDALEIARLRGQSQAAQQREQQNQTATEAQAAQQRGLQSLQQLGQQLSQRDGKQLFEAKMAVIQTMLNSALPDLPPAKWAEYAQKLYDGAPAPAPAQAKPRIGKQPVRQSHATSGAPGGGSIHPNKPADPFAAFDQGIREAREAGL